MKLRCRVGKCGADNYQNGLIIIPIFDRALVRGDGLKHGRGSLILQHSRQPKLFELLPVSAGGVTRRRSQGHV